MEQHSKSRIIEIEIYTDGSLKKMGKMSVGGWAFIVIKDSKKIYYETGSEIKTTNQRMELTAILMALRYAQAIRRDVEKVVIYSDSAYAINCYTQEWYVKWQQNGWVTSSDQEVANRDLWEEIIPYFDNFWYTFKKVKGHDNVLWNEECDSLAQGAADFAKKHWRGLLNE